MMEVTTNGKVKERMTVYCKLLIQLITNNRSVLKGKIFSQ